MSFARGRAGTGCLDVRQGIAENDSLIGGFSEDGLWTPDPAAGAVIHPYWPPTSCATIPRPGLFAVAAAPETHMRRANRA